jgi:hypothetical protein
MSAGAARTARGTRAAVRMVVKYMLSCVKSSCDVDVYISQVYDDTFILPSHLYQRHYTSTIVTALNSFFA